MQCKQQRLDIESQMEKAEKVRVILNEKVQKLKCQDSEEINNPTKDIRISSFEDAWAKKIDNEVELEAKELKKKIINDIQNVEYGVEYGMVH